MLSIIVKEIRSIQRNNNKEEECFLFKINLRLHSFFLLDDFLHFDEKYRQKFYFLHSIYKCTNVHGIIFTIPYNISNFSSCLRNSKTLNDTNTNSSRQNIRAHFYPTVFIFYKVNFIIPFGYARSFLIIEFVCYSKIVPGIIT